MGGKISKNKKRNNRNSSINNQNILNYNLNNSNHINNNNIDLSNIDSLIDNNVIDNLINSDHSFSSYTDDYIEYNNIIEIELRNHFISNGIIDGIHSVDNNEINNSNSNINNNSSGNNNNINNNNNNNNYNYNNLIFSHHQHNGSCRNSCSGNSSNGSSVFVMYNSIVNKKGVCECPKELATEVQKRISTFKKSLMIDQLDLNLKEFQFNLNIDFISTTLSKEIQYYILSYLSIYDVLSLFQVNKYWYELSLNNSFWKSLLYRDMDKWNNREAIKLTIKNYEIQNHIEVSWKKYYANINRLRLCKKCAIVYRESSNYLTACSYHADIRDIVHSRGVPSGVYWICCLSKPKQAPGCTTSSHDELNRFDYLPPLI